MEKEVKINQLCFAWYPRNKITGSELDLFYCIPIKIGAEYSICRLFSGSIERKLHDKGIFTDVCTNDLKPI